MNSQTILISYDLLKPGQNYTELHEAIKNLGTWWHCLESVWIVKSNLTASTIRNNLKVHIDKNDKLLVIDVNRTAAWVGFDTKCSDWLQSNL